MGGIRDYMTQYAFQKIIFSNLEKIRVGARQYMMSEGVTEASFDELTGNNPKRIRYISEIVPVEGESYSGAVIYQSAGQITLIKSDGGSVTFK